jgi:methionyl-tRNA formyltransferase
LFVVGTFDSTIETLLTVDLMRCLDEAGVPPAVVVFKRSNPSMNPAAPVAHRLDDACTALHVDDFNAAETIDRIRALAPDLLVYAGGKDLLRKPLLDSARLGCLGGHYGQLPAVRGMSSVEWSVIAGVPMAVSVQRMSTGVDMGDIVMRSAVPLFAGDNFTSIRNRSYFLTKSMLALAARRVLIDGVGGQPQTVAQGRQYFRMHPALEARAVRGLTQLLAARFP